MELGLLEFIKPLEFTFCSRCGRNVRYGKKEFMCIQCKRNMFSSDKSLSEEEKLAISYEEQVGGLIREHREGLAKLRKNHNG